MAASNIQNGCTHKSSFNIFNFNYFSSNFDWNLHQNVWFVVILHLVYFPETPKMLYFELKTRAQNCAMHSIMSDNMYTWNIEVKGPWYAWKIFCHFCQGKQLLWLPVCFPSQQAPSEMGSTLKGNHLLPEGSNSFRLELTPFRVYSFSEETWYTGM